MCLTQGIYPSHFKTALLTPLVNKKPYLDKNDLKNYRPVSNLNYISKLLEKVVANQLKKHLGLNGLHNPRQSAYREGHSTESALLSVSNDIHLNFAKGESTALILLDLSAAFDTIDHSILLHRLSSCFGIGGRVIKWLRSYLNDRSQTFKLDNTFSDRKHVK